MGHVLAPPLDLQRRQIRRLARGAIAYAAAFGAGVFAWLRWVGAGEGGAGALVCALPALAAAWALLGGLSPARNAIAKVLAVGMFGPLLLLFWAGEQVPAGVAAWAFFVPAALLHAAVFVATIVSMGKTMARVDPVADAPRASTAALRRRLVSLATLARSGCTLHPAADGTLVFELGQTEQRRHCVLLDLHAETGEVRVRERMTAAGAAPVDAEEASMRGPGDAPFDPARPAADRVWNSVRQTTVLEPELLEAVALRFEGDEVRGTLPASDGEGVLAALCTVVTRSGWAWQPVWRG